MKPFLPLLPVLCLLITAGCASTQNGNTSGVFMTEFGEKRVGDVVVEVREAGGKLVVKPTNTRTTLETLPKWSAQPGWFAFVKDGNVWAYDGGQQLLLVTQRGLGETTTMSIYSQGDFPVSVPAAVASRVKEPLRSQLR